jgi:hypothetical protein
MMERVPQQAVVAALEEELLPKPNGKDLPEKGRRRLMNAMNVTSVKCIPCGTKKRT